MKTLKTVWEAKGLTHNELAEISGIGVSTIYKMNRMEDVKLSTAIAIFDALGITLEDYRKLEPCGQAEKYAKKRKGHRHA